MTETFTGSSGIRYLITDEDYLVTWFRNKEIPKVADIKEKVNNSQEYQKYKVYTLSSATIRKLKADFPNLGVL